MKGIRPVQIFQTEKQNPLIINFIGSLPWVVEIVQSMSDYLQKLRV